MTDDLRRRIAEWLGWQPAPGNWLHETWKTPDGAFVEWRSAPDWQRDANTALALPIPPGYGWVLFRLGENYHARLTTTGEVMRTAREAWSPDGVAAAIAEAWGQWMDAKGEG